MKILSFELFESKKEKPIKIDKYIINRMDKAKSIGAVEEYTLDFDKSVLDIKLHDGKRILKKLKIHPFLKRDWASGAQRITQTPMYTFTSSYNEETYTVGSQHDEEFWDEFNKIEKDFIKINQTKTISFKGKEYSLNDFYSELLPSLEIYQKIIHHNYVDITTTSEKKNGTVTIEKRKPEDFIQGPYKITGPPHKITKNGKLYRMSSHPLILQSYKPLITLEDYEKCLNWLFDNVFNKEIEEEIAYWKEKIEKNPKKLVKLAGDMPEYISKMFLSPKLHNLKKTGLFDNDKD